MMFRWYGSAGVILVLGATSALSCSDDGEPGTSTGGTSAGGASNAGSAGTSAAGTSSAGTGMGTAGSGGAGMQAEDVSFATDVWPILTANCSGVGCHGDGSFLPEHASSNVDTAYGEAEEVADLILGRVSGALMPIMPQFCGPAPGFGECLSLEEVALIRAWVDQGAAP